jgi:NitT/TauT family transport system ATP-binding protein
VTAAALAPAAEREAAAAADPGPAGAGRPPLVALRGVEKRFANGTLALAGLDLAVGRHEFVSLLGPSGCGKSTALRLMAGLARPTRGRVELDAGAATAAGAGGGGVGFVFQEPTLLPWATVFDNVRLPLRLRGRGRREVADEVRDVLATVGLDRFAGAYPRELSGGMRMRVSIARALVTRPALLLMDEPFAALDEITRHRLNNDLLALWQGQSWTVVFVTHSVYESVYLSRRIVVMAARPGRVVADIPVEAAYPRGEAYRTSEPYNRACRLVSAELRRAMGEG